MSKLALLCCDHFIYCHYRCDKEVWLSKFVSNKNILIINGRIFSNKLEYKTCDVHFIYKFSINIYPFMTKIIFV
jgi:hypothetical protein